MNEFDKALKELWKKFKKPHLNFSCQIYDGMANESQYYRDGHSLILLGLLEDHKHMICEDVRKETNNDL